MSHTNIHFHSELIQTGNNASPILLLHGWGHTSAKLKPLGDLLGKHAQVHLIDLPGFGKSSPPDFTWGTFDYADRLIKYLDEHQIEQTDLLGHSFGGKIALSFAIRYPQRIRRLILIGSSGLKPKRTFLKRCRLAVIKLGSKCMKLFDRFCGTYLYQTYFIPRFASKDYQQAGALRPILVRTVNEDFSELIPQVKCPTLLIWGRDDTETPPEIGERMQRGIQSSQLRIFPFKGHEPFNDVGSHLCATYITPFILEPHDRHHQ